MAVPPNAANPVQPGNILAPALPHVNLSAGVHPILGNVLHRRLDPETHRQYMNYLKVTRLGVVAILRPADSEKAEFGAVAACTLLANEDTDTIICSAPTHEATISMAESLYRVTQDVHKELGTGFNPLVVRAHRLSGDTSAFITISIGRPCRDAEDPASDDLYVWVLRLSACEWLLKVVGARSFRLAASDPKSLYKLRRDVLARPRFAGLHMFTNGDIPFDDIQKNTPQSSPDLSPRALVEELLEMIVELAGIVCTTPLLSCDPIYKRFNDQHAKAVMLYNAGSMMQVDALMVWGRGCRPLVLLGDPQDTPVSLATHGQKRGGRVVNMFAKMVQTSVLEQLKRSSWPCFELRGGGGGI